MKLGAIVLDCAGTDDRWVVVNDFVGSTIIYAFMQAVGMVNDHTSDCFVGKEK